MNNDEVLGRVLLRQLLCKLQYPNHPTTRQLIFDFLIADLRYCKLTEECNVRKFLVSWY